jgi:hypothetical protein
MLIRQLLRKLRLLSYSLPVYDYGPPQPYKVRGVACTAMVHTF